MSKEKKFIGLVNFAENYKNETTFTNEQQKEVFEGMSMKESIEKSIRETLVIDNKQSIGIAVEKIMKLIETNKK